ncbi:MAG: LysM peptidoglycan-binding domain-containing protein [Anaerolineales bacterium]|nr:LysM peptidoglycan-binding domain-containing protein [Anaerolineales bacterium]
MSSLRRVIRLSAFMAVAAAVFCWAAPAYADTSYVVQPGDTLTRIAARQGTTVELLVQANHLKNANAIQVGQTLIIPDGSASAAPAASAGGGTYVVQPGDSLARIAARLQVDLDALIRANALTSSVLHPGQTLIIPAAGAPAQVPQRIRGDAAFTRRVQAALDWLQAADANAYARVDTYVTLIIPSPYRNLAQAQSRAGGCLVRALARADMSTPMIAVMLLHESIHCQQFAAGGELTSKTAEVEAYTEQLAFMNQHGFSAAEIAYYEKVLAYYQSQPDGDQQVPPPNF